MKQFLYLDNDIVNSIIAQNEQGLIQSLSSEQEANETESDATHGNIAVKGTIGGSLFKLAKAEVDLSSNIGYDESSSTFYASKELVSKTLHDAAFDMAYTYIDPSVCAIKDHSNDDYGNYIEVTRVFDFIDLDYLEKLFAKGGFIEYLKKTEKEKIEALGEEAKSQMNREQLRAKSSEIRSFIKDKIAKNSKQYEDVHDIIVAFKQLIPYSKMLISNDGYLVPLDDNYFRINPANMGFKYGGEITCVGMITNIIGEDTDPCDDKNIFATLQFSVNEALRSILPTSETNLCVIHPIAVFYNR